MELSVEITTKEMAGRLEAENAKQKMLHVISRAEWAIANPDRAAGQKVEVSGEELTQQQLEEVIKIYNKGGWQATRITIHDGTRYVQHMRLI